MWFVFFRVLIFLKKTQKKLKKGVDIFPKMQ